jgi:hypothetical protein
MGGSGEGEVADPNMGIAVLQGEEIGLETCSR